MATGDSATRLGLFSVLPAGFAVAYFLRRFELKLTMAEWTMMIMLIFASSLHHIFSSPQLPSIAALTVIQLICVGGIWALISRGKIELKNH